SQPSRGAAVPRSRPRTAPREQQPIPGTVCAAVGRASRPRGSRRFQRSVSTGSCRVLDGAGRLRARGGRGRDPMRTLYIVGAVAVSALAVGGCSRVQGVDPKPVRPVKAQAVAAAPATGSVKYSASIEAFEQVTLAFKSSGYVDDLMRRAGADGR